MLKEIPGISGYRVSEDGAVWSDKTDKFLSIWTNNKGRHLVTLSIDGLNKHFQISRLVAFVFEILPNLTSDLEVDHIDRDFTNNHYTNLQALSISKHLDKTISDKNQNKRTYPLCQSCNKELTVVVSKTGLCKSCSESSITVEDIIYWVKNHSWVRASKELGMTDNGLRKRYKKLTGLDPKLLKKE